MRLTNFKVYAQKRFLENGIELMFYQNLRDGKLTFLDNLVFQTIQESDAIKSEPSGLMLPLELSQQLMDALWDCGIRPSEGSGSAGALLATQNHLKDLQDVIGKLFSIVNKT